MSSLIWLVSLFGGEICFYVFNKYVHFWDCSLKYKKSNSSHFFCMKHLLMSSTFLKLNKGCILKFSCYSNFGCFYTSCHCVIQFLNYFN